MRSKLDPKAIPVYFVGYTYSCNTYRLYDAAANIVTSRCDVNFIDSEKEDFIVSGKQYHEENDPITIQRQFRGRSNSESKLNPVKPKIKPFVAKLRDEPTPDLNLDSDEDKRNDMTQDSFHDANETGNNLTSDNLIDISEHIYDVPRRRQPRDPSEYLPPMGMIDPDITESHSSIRESQIPGELRIGSQLPEILPSKTRSGISSHLPNEAN